MKVDTKDEPPIRQNMRRTPFSFQKEEEDHLRLMLDAVVISPSSLPEWASCPVLVR